VHPEQRQINGTINGNSNSNGKEERSTD